MIDQIRVSWYYVARHAGSWFVWRWRSDGFLMHRTQRLRVNVSELSPDTSQRQIHEYSLKHVIIIHHSRGWVYCALRSRCQSNWSSIHIQSFRMAIETSLLIACSVFLVLDVYFAVLIVQYWLHSDTIPLSSVVLCLPLCLPHQHGWHCVWRHFQHSSGSTVHRALSLICLWWQSKSPVCILYSCDCWTYSFRWMSNNGFKVRLYRTAMPITTEWLRWTITGNQPSLDVFMVIANRCWIWIRFAGCYNYLISDRFSTTTLAIMSTISLGIVFLNGFIVQDYFSRTYVGGIECFQGTPLVSIMHILTIPPFICCVILAVKLRTRKNLSFADHDTQCYCPPPSLHNAMDSMI